MKTLSGKTLFITGASRGIGRAIALRAARDGANIAIASKSSVANPKLPGTIHSVAAEVEAAGGRALALKCDIREEDEVRASVAATVDMFGGIDILVNNASAIWLQRHARHADEALRPDAAGQRARQFPVRAGLPAVPAAGAEPAHPVAGAAAEPRPEMVGAAHRLHAGEDGHELRHPGPGGGVRPAGRGGQCAVAAHDRSPPMRST